MVGQNWDTQADWDAASKDGITVDGGVFTLASAIPDSEANQKLVHRWYLSEASAPFVDQVGTADSTSVTGTTQVSSTEYVDNAARDGDGTDDVIETTTWGTFGSNMGSGWAIAFSINAATVDTEYIPIGVNNGGDFQTTFMQISINRADQANGTIELAIQDDSNNGLEVVAGGISANTNHRIVVNVPDNNASNAQIFLDQSELTTTINRDESPSNFADFTANVPLFARNNGGFDSHLDGIIDDVCVFGDSLTTTETQSYSNPWQ